MSGKAALAFATNFGGGYMGGKRQAVLDEERKADRQMRQDEHDARMRDMNRTEGDRVALQNAARPVSVDQGANGMIKPDTMDNADVGLPENASLPNQGLQPGGFKVGDQTFTDRAGADAAAAKANAPEATDTRIANALRSRGNVVGAKNYEAAAADLADKNWNREISQAMANGHEGMADFLTRTQVGPLKGVTVKAIPSEDGKTVTYSTVNPDGTMTPKHTWPNSQDGVIMAGYQLAHVAPEVRYKHMVEEDKQAFVQQSKEDELKLRQRQLEEVQIPNAETRATLAQVRAQLAEIQSQRSNGGVGREERLRYTSLFSDAGRRMQDTQKSISALQRDPLFTRALRKDPNGPEAQQMQQLQADLKSHQEERTLYQGLLAGSQGTGAAPASASASAPAAAPAAAPASATKVPPAVQKARDGDRVQILQDELTAAQKRLASGDPRAQGDIDALNREISGTQGKPVRLASATPKNGAAKAPAQPGSSRESPIKVSTAAERDQLAPGAYYTAPDGQTYIKQ